MDTNFIVHEDGTISWSPTLIEFVNATKGKRFTVDEFNKLFIGVATQGNHTAASLAAFVEAYNDLCKKLEQSGGGGSGGGKTYLYMDGTPGPYGYEYFFVLPDFANVDTIKIVYTEQKVYNEGWGAEMPEIRNKDIVIYENDKKLTGITLNILAFDENYTSDYKDVPLIWNSSDTYALTLSFISIPLPDGVYSYYTGNSTKIMFEIKFK